MQDQMSFDEYERDWMRRHKGSIPRKRRVSSTREWFWIGFWVIVATGAAIFSAAHTIPAAELTILNDVPYRSDLAKTAFVIVELVIFGAAAGRREITWLKWLLIASVLVALVGNVSSSVRAVTENQGDLLNQFGGILLSIIAPVTALAAGEVLHIQLDKRTAKMDKADEEYDTAIQALNQKINTAYSRYMKDSVAARAADFDVNLRKFTSIDRPTPKMKKAIEWLQEHPEHIDTESRALADLIGVSHTLANDARKVVKYRLNGHGNNGHIQ